MADLYCLRWKAEFQDRETSAAEIDKMRSAGPWINRRAGNEKGRSDREAQLRRWLCDGLSWKPNCSPGSSQLSTTLTHYFHTSCLLQSQNQQCLFLALHYDFSKSSEIWNIDSLGKNPSKQNPKKPKTKPERWQGLSNNEMAPNLTHENGSHQILPRKEKNENKCCHIKPMILLTVETILFPFYK